MRKKQEIQKKVYESALPYGQKFGHPLSRSVASDGSDDDEANISQLLNLGQKSPFSTIASNLYNIDYKNRIIVIDEGIDERCFVYAKMIENWNRTDLKVINLKAKFQDYLKKNPEIGPLLGLVVFDSVEEANIKIQEILDKYPELKPSLAELQNMDIPNTKILEYEATPIKIKFNSPGGWMLAYETLADVIKLSKTKVIGINMGMAYSAAAFLLVACHERLALPKSHMLVHRGSGGNYGSFEQTESFQQHYKSRINKMMKSFQERTKIPYRILNKYMTPDWYLTAEEALKYGMIDRIVTDITEII